MAFKRMKPRRYSPSNSLITVPLLLLFPAYTGDCTQPTPAQLTVTPLVDSAAAGCAALTPPALPQLARVCEFASISRVTMPNFICHEEIEQFSSSRHGRSWRQDGTVTAEVRIVEGKEEQYREIRLNGQPFNGTMRDLPLNLWTVGEFGSDLVTIFRPRLKALFESRGEEKGGRERLLLYNFAIEQANNDGSFKWYAGERQYWPGIQGTIWVGKDTGKLRQLQINLKQADAEFPYDRITRTTEYRETEISALGTFLLPAQSETISCRRDSHWCYRSKLSFNKCRKFGSESRMTIP